MNPPHENFLRTPLPAPLLATVLIIGNDFFVFHTFPLPSNFFLPPCPTDDPAYSHKISRKALHHYIAKIMGAILL